MVEDEHHTWNFTGFRLSVGNNGGFQQDQKDYLKKLEYLRLDEMISELIYMRMRLAWLENRIIDFLFEIPQLDLVTEYQYM